MRLRSYAVVAVAVFVAGLVSATPAAASDGGDLGALGASPEAPSPDGTIVDGHGDSPPEDADSTPDGLQSDDPQPDGFVDEPLVEEQPHSEVPPVGPGNAEEPAEVGAAGSEDSLGSVAEPTFDIFWESGSVVPSRVSVVLDDDNVELHTWRAEDGSWLMAWLVIDGLDAATEYHFEKAVPPQHSAVVQSDGSVVFYDSEGAEAGGIATPWAFDSDGAEVPTSFRLEGDTLVQTVDHHGAKYPVTADPLWLREAVRRCVDSPQCTYYATEAVRVVPTAVGTIWRSRKHLSSGNSSEEGRRPTNRCNMRNRAGC